ncbi:hypothetical protein FBU59_001707 [Linderina macrospora]|uniref:Uncharacterized protein n=1 Tax=Linderina macrospora TaxID=4868 RepID=A0ACC1JD35_9FUNG|nr:hypothetical protein FBU59_001707 [Linderina macrospora]
MSNTNEKSIPLADEQAAPLPPPAYNIETATHVAEPAQVTQPAQAATATRTTYVAPQMQLDNVSAMVHCPGCNKDVMTRVEREMSSSTTVAAVLVCCICWPAGLYMCMSDSMKENHHKCSSCGHDLGKIITVTDVAPAAQPAPAA